MTASCDGMKVYLLRAGPYAKIGVTDNIGRRIAQLQTACPEKIVLESYKDVCCREHAFQIESDLHRWPESLGWRLSGEWFKGGVLIESHFDCHYGQQVSLCCDGEKCSVYARRFIGVPMVMHREGSLLDSTMYPIGNYWAMLGPASDINDHEVIGYAMSYTMPDVKYEAVGWYRVSDGVLTTVLFDGSWSTISMENWTNAIKREDAVYRNAILQDTRFFLPRPNDMAISQ